MPIEIYQGRTLYRTIRIKADGQPYTLQSGEKILFGVKRGKWSGEYLIFKTLTSNDEIGGGYPLVLTPEDTDILTGYHKYDVGVALSDGSYHDIQSNDDFIVRSVTTHKGDDLNAE